MCVNNYSGRVFCSVSSATLAFVNCPRTSKLLDLIMKTVFHKEFYDANTLEASNVL